MRDYPKSDWGFTLIWGLRASVFPRALCMAIPNALIAFLIGHYMEASPRDQGLADNAFSVWAGFSSVLFFILFFRSNVAYGRWWEGGTLLQQTRGEWFNAYSSLIAFTSPDPKKEGEVEAYQHMLARLMSLLFCCALQQVSPNRERPFEIIDSEGLDPVSLEFLEDTTDRVEVILQWIQRSTILNMQNGVLPIPPPVMSRAFQEISRGIVNLQNARKIADFPFPFPYAQTSIVMLCIHWIMCPVLANFLLARDLAAATCFIVIFFLWCVNFIALQLEAPFGSGDNDLPMDQMQSDWNKSVATLLAKRANHPPAFTYDASTHKDLSLRMSDGAKMNTKRNRLTVAMHVKPQKETKSSSGKLVGGNSAEVSDKASVGSIGVSSEEAAPKVQEEPAGEPKAQEKREEKVKEGLASPPPQSAVKPALRRQVTAKPQLVGFGPGSDAVAAPEAAPGGGAAGAVSEPDEKKVSEPNSKGGGSKVADDGPNHIVLPMDEGNNRASGSTCEPGDGSDKGSVDAGPDPPTSSPTRGPPRRRSRSSAGKDSAKRGSKGTSDGS